MEVYCSVQYSEKVRGVKWTIWGCTSMYSLEVLEVQRGIFEAALCTVEELEV